MKTLDSDFIGGGLPEKKQLALLAHKFGTDKLTHGYIPYYEMYLPIKVNKLLEIGVDQGASLKMWKEYLPGCEIHGIDLFHEKSHVKSELEAMGIICHQGDQIDLEFLSTIKDEFDVIIDDGNHNMLHQQFTFDHLFVNNLKSKCNYIIEDLHTSSDPGWYGNVPFESRTLNALRFFQRNRYWKTCFIPGHELAYWQNTIDKISIFLNKIAFIRKR